MTTRYEINVKETVEYELVEHYSGPDHGSIRTVCRCHSKEDAEKLAEILRAHPMKGGPTVKGRSVAEMAEDARRAQDVTERLGLRKKPASEGAAA